MGQCEKRFTLCCCLGALQFPRIYVSVQKTVTVRGRTCIRATSAHKRPNRYKRYLLCIRVLGLPLRRCFPRSPFILQQKPLLLPFLPPSPSFLPRNYSRDLLLLLFSSAVFVNEMVIASSSMLQLLHSCTLAHSDPKRYHVCVNKINIGLISIGRFQMQVSIPEMRSVPLP